MTFWPTDHILISRLNFTSDDEAVLRSQHVGLAPSNSEDAAMLQGLALVFKSLKAQAARDAEDEH